MEATTLKEETTTLKKLDISIPEKYVSLIRTLVKSLGGKAKALKEKKSGTID